VFDNIADLHERLKVQATGRSGDSHPPNILRVFGVIDTISLRDLCCEIAGGKLEFCPETTMLTNQSRIDGVRGVHEWSETSSKENLLETFAKERKIRDCTKAPETLAENSPFAIFGLCLVSKQNLTNDLAILDYGAIQASVAERVATHDWAHQCCLRENSSNILPSLDHSEGKQGIPRRSASSALCLVGPTTTSEE
jgi:hypothetical protein